MGKELEKHQDDALDAAYALLAEHFESFVVLVDTSISDKQTISRILWKGGHMTGLGLLGWGKQKILSLVQ